jgi:hypothetical protein
LKQVAIRGPYAWGRIDSLDSELLGGRRRGDWLLPCAAIDAAFYTCGMQVRAHVGGVAMIPQSIERLRWGRLPRTGEPLLAWACCNEMDTERANFDFFLFGDNEEVIVHAMGYHGVFVPRGGRELDEQLNPRTSPLT